MPGHDERGWLRQLPQGRFHDLARIGGESGLRRDGIADVVALEGQSDLDAGRQVEAGKSLVDTPQPALERHRLVPAAGLAEVVERDALARDDAGRTRHPA